MSLSEKASAPEGEASTGAIFSSEEVMTMIPWAAAFLVLALVAAALGFSGIAGVATQIAWLLFVAGLVLVVIWAIRGRPTI
jgi:uncharacterized membrane protein YtjA (UPF0391 family)